MAMHRISAREKAVASGVVAMLLLAALTGPLIAQALARAQRRLHRATLNRAHRVAMTHRPTFFQRPNGNA